MKQNETAKLTLDVKLAPKGHFSNNGSGIKPGMIFFLRSPSSGVFDSSEYYTYEGMNEEEFVSWYKNKMIYVPKSKFDNNGGYGK